MTLFAVFYDLKVTHGSLELYYHEDFYKATYSRNVMKISYVMKISTRLRTVPTYALDWATVVAHIPWISQFSFIVKLGAYKKIARSRHTLQQQLFSYLYEATKMPDS